MINSSTDDFRPTANWSNLRLRADMLRRLREFFDSRGFLEVETPVLSADTVIDRHLDPFSTEIDGIGRLAAAGTAACAGADVPSAAKRMWLQTSPEFHMKRLLADGAGAIYQVARVFRQGELGPLHNPEFTLVEWYRPDDGLDEGMQLTSELCKTLLGRGPAERMSYREAFERYVGLDPHAADAVALAAAVEKSGIQPPATLAREDRDG
ncbi:MAG: EF-P lysine aminoacylase GenX, partial [Pirellulales bacterium]|nr:EF-P lysine aminoacylase GenX [Pirellulales bacterium]